MKKKTCSDQNAVAAVAGDLDSQLPMDPALLHFLLCCGQAGLASLFTPEVAIAFSSLNLSELASFKRPLTNQIVFFYQARESSLIPAGFQTAQFLQEL